MPICYIVFLPQYIHNWYWLISVVYFQNILETTGFSTSEGSGHGGAAKVNYGLAAGFGICALLVILLLIALALVMYQKYVERIEADEAK